MTSTVSPIPVEPEKKALSCHQCRARKLKCNRVWPCERCLSSGEKCEFPTGRQKPKEPIKRTRFKQLESKIHELEHRFKDDDATSPSQNGSSGSQYATFDSPPSASMGSEIFSTGRLEQQPPQDLVDELVNLYFLQKYPEAPMQHPGRYFASLQKPPQMQPPLCLQYIILAMGATVSPQHNALALPFYYRAKNYMNYDDMKDDGYLGITVAHAQCWELLSHFEASQLWFTRAPTSTSRAVRLAQMLGLDTIDVSNSSKSILPPAIDLTEQEERRRTMWSIFCTDLDTSSTTNWPKLLQPEKIHTLLPVSDDSFIQGYPEPSVSLKKALRDSASQYSDYACRILASLLFYECSSFTNQRYAARDAADDDIDKDFDTDFDTLTAEDFLTTHQRLDNRLALLFMALPDRVAHPSTLTGSPDTAPIILKLHTSVIAIHRRYLSRLRSEYSDFANTTSNNPEILNEITTSVGRMLISANEIHTLLSRTVRNGTTTPQTAFTNVFTTFAAFMASFAFLEDINTTQSKESEARVYTLMDLLIAGAENNSMAASLAVQLGHEVWRSNMDRNALWKVQGIVDRMDKGFMDALMGKQDVVTGSFTFCPLARKTPGA